MISGSEPDPVLTALVRTVNAQTSEVTVGVTLTLTGSVVSGYLVPAQTWFEAMSVEAAASPGDGRDWALLFTHYAEEMHERAQHRRVAKELDEQLPDRYAEAIRAADPEVYVHLQQARVYGGHRDDGFPTGGMAWRGRLADVAGWAFGVVGIPAADGDDAR